MATYKGKQEQARQWFDGYALYGHSLFPNV